MMRSTGLWRFDLVPVDSPVRRLAEMFSVDEGRRRYGVRLSFADKIQKKDDYVNKLWHSRDAGQT